MESTQSTQGRARAPEATGSTSGALQDLRLAQGQELAGPEQKELNIKGMSLIKVSIHPLCLHSDESICSLNAFFRKMNYVVIMSYLK